MKNSIIVFSFIFLFLLTGCVQKTKERVIVFTMEKPNVSAIKTVGIRGKDSPLSWENDLPMYFDKQSNRYKAIVKINTGYLSTEVKFTVNGVFEFKDQENRKVNFDDKDTIFYNAKFDVR